MNEVMLDETRAFDELAEAVAQAFSDGDIEAGDRLYCELHARFIAPDMHRRLRFFVWDTQRREEVASRIIEQIYERRFRCGKVVYRRFLSTMYRRCAWDERHAEHRHLSRAAEPGPDVELEELIARSSARGNGASIADHAARAVDVTRVLEHFERDLDRPQWVLVLSTMLEGHLRGADVAAVTGISQVRVRQLKMEIGRYLRGPGRGLLLDGKES